MEFDRERLANVTAMTHRRQQQATVYGALV
jgi:hypothetical protein